MKAFFLTFLLAKKMTRHRISKNVGFLLLFFVYLLISFGGYAQDTSRIYGGNYSKERITNLRSNVKQYDWAREDLQRVVKRAAVWVSKSDEELWKMVPGQDLPRTIDVTYSYFKTPRAIGCLVCGNNILPFGNYPYTVDFENQPWKITCPYCHTVFPSNDFGKFYESGIDEHGLFHPENGDTSLLFNVEHPDPTDSLHKYAVDNGYGYDNGERAFKFIGYYTWKLWGYIIEGTAALANAYLYTGDQVYAHKAAILLDRIADVYPSLDWKKYADMGWYHSDGSSKMGKIEGRIWETGNATTLADAYDKILSGTVNDASLFEFLNLQSKKYQLPATKGTRELFVKNVDDHLLKEIVAGVLSKRIYGNEGMHQRSMTAAAIAFNDKVETTKWLDWVYSPEGGNIPGLIINTLDRDGTSDEGAPGYATILGYSLVNMADALENYPEYTKHRIFRDFPKFKEVFKVAYRMAALGKATPNIGDAGSTGLVTKNSVNPHIISKGFQYTGDSSIAVIAYRANGNSAKGLGFDVFAKDPEWAHKEIDRIGKAAGERPVGGYLMNGFGMASLEIGGKNSNAALAMNYGRTIKHAHLDLLNFDLFAFSNWMTPDHGYPEFASSVPSRNEWTNSTISHNLVLVNQKPQSGTWGGKTKLFAQLDDFGVISADGKPAYPALQEYARTMFLIGNGDDSYALDVFDVKGGNDHLYILHTPPGEATTHDLDLTAQMNGSYAGKNIDKGTPAKDFPLGYSFLYNVAKDGDPANNFVIDWKIGEYRGIKPEDNIHVRVHSTTEVQDVAIALGDPPQNKPGNPKTLNYLLLHREGENLNSSFVTLLEPYKEHPFIRSVKRLADENPNLMVVQVDKMDGMTDFVLLNKNPVKSVSLNNQIKMEGEVGLVRVDQRGDPVKGILMNGKSLSLKKMKIKSLGTYTGKVVEMSQRPDEEGWILIESNIPMDDKVVGQQIKINTDGPRDANYKIRKISKQEGLTKIVVEGEGFINSFKRDNKNETSYPDSYNYDFNVGDTFEIPSISMWEK